MKRIVLIGDHFQLPPVVKHIAFQKHAHLDQSLFTRFIRLGVPAVLLNKQGRARPEIAALYSWRYSNLGSQNNTKNDHKNDNIDKKQSFYGLIREITNTGLSHTDAVTSISFGTSPDLKGISRQSSRFLDLSPCRS